MDLRAQWQYSVHNCDFAGQGSSALFRSTECNYGVSPFLSGIGPNNILEWNLRGCLVRAMTIVSCAQWQSAEVDCSPIPPEIAKWTLRRSLTSHRSMSIRPDQHCESATIVKLQQKNALIGLVHSSGAFPIGEMVFGQMHRSFHWEIDSGTGAVPLESFTDLALVWSCGRGGIWS